MNVPSDLMCRTTGDSPYSGLCLFHDQHLLTVQALGIKPKTIRAPKQPSLDQRDMAQLMQRGEDEEDEDPARQAERIKGLGYRV